MKNKFDFFSAILLGINGIIGFMIFLLPGEIYSKLGLISIFAYFAVGLFAICITLCFTKMTGYFSKNGTVYVCTKEVFVALRSAQSSL